MSKGHSKSTQTRLGVGESTYADLGPKLRVGSREVLATLNCLAHPRIYRLPVGSTEHGPRAEKREWVVLCSGVVDRNVPQHVLADLLGQVDVDA